MWNHIRMCEIILACVRRRKQTNDLMRFLECLKWVLLYHSYESVLHSHLQKKYGNQYIITDQFKSRFLSVINEFYCIQFLDFSGNFLRRKSAKGFGHPTSWWCSLEFVKTLHTPKAVAAMWLATFIYSNKHLYHSQFYKKLWQ